MVPWIDKFIKLLDDIALVHLRRRNLNQIVIDRRKSCGFHVKHDISRFV